MSTPRARSATRISRPPAVPSVSGPGLLPDIGRRGDHVDARIGGLAGGHANAGHRRMGVDDPGNSPVISSSPAGAEQIVGQHPRLVVGAMRVGRDSRHVPGRPDMGHPGHPALRVHGQRAIGSGADADRVQAQPGGRRGPAHSQDQLLRLDCRAPIQLDPGVPARGRFHGLHLGAEPEVHTVTAQHTSQLPGNGGVLTADQLGIRLNQGHVSTEPGVNLSQLAADRAAAKNDQ